MAQVVESIVFSIIDRTSQGLGNISRNIAALSANAHTLASGIQSISKSNEAVQKSMNAMVANLTAGLSQVTAAINRTHVQASKPITTKVDVDDGKARGVIEALHKVRTVTVAAVATGAFLGYPVHQAIKQESALYSAARQMNNPFEDGRMSADLLKFKDDMQKLARIIPVSSIELMGIATEGMKAGIKQEDAVKYTEMIAKISSALDLDTKDTAEKFSQISSIYNMSIDQVKRLGDIINNLDDNSNANASDILEVTKRISSEASKFLKPHEAAALATALKGAGKTREVAGSAGGALIRELSLAVAQPKKFDAAMKELGKTDAEIKDKKAFYESLPLQLGLSKEAIAKAVTTDAIGALVMIQERAKMLPAEKQMGIAVGLYGKEYGGEGDLLTSISDMLYKNLAIAGDKRFIGLIKDEKIREDTLAAIPKTEGSVERQFNISVQSTENQLKLAANSANNLAEALAKNLLPAIKSTAQAAEGLAAILNGTSEGSQDTMRTIKAVTVGIGTMGVALAALNFSSVIAGLTAFGASIVSWLAGLKVVGFVMAAIAGVPALLVAAIVALGVAAGMVYYHWDSIKVYLSDGMQWVADKFYDFMTLLGSYVEKLTFGDSEKYIEARNLARAREKQLAGIGVSAPDLRRMDEKMIEPRLEIPTKVLSKTPEQMLFPKTSYLEQPTYKPLPLFSSPSVSLPNQQEVGGRVEIVIDNQNQVNVKDVKSKNERVPVTVNTGSMFGNYAFGA